MKEVNLLKINTCFFSRICGYKKNVLRVVFLVFGLILEGCECSKNVKNDEISQSEQLIWSNFTKADSIVNQIDTLELSPIDVARWKRLQLEFRMWKNECLSSEDSITAQWLIRYFEEKKDYESLCKTYFVIGNAYYCQLRTYDAITYLKEGEYLIDYLPDSSMYAYLIKYTLGETSEQEQLFSVAHNYYKESLPYAKKVDNSYLLRACYLNIARTPLRTMTWEERVAYFDTAQYYAYLLHDTIHALEIDIQRMLHNPPVDSALLIPLCRKMNDTYGNIIYNHNLVEYYAYHDIDMSQYYFNICAKDTTRSPWMVNQYHYLESLINFQKGEKDLAYRQLERIYRGIYDKIQEDGHTRSYAIARQMDLEKEKQKTLEQTIQKQKYMLLFSLSGTALLFVLLLFVSISYSYIKRNYRIQKENEELSNEIALRKMEARNSLKKQIQLIRRYAQLPDDARGLFPDSIHQFFEENMLVTPEQQAHFLHTTNKLFDGALDDIRQLYPNLTSADILYITLVALGMDNEDIRFLLNISSQSLRNRRQRIKRHISNSDLQISTFCEQLFDEVLRKGQGARQSRM